MNPQSLQTQYRVLEQARHEFIEVGHKCAVLTIPSVQPRENMNRAEFPNNFQSIGARGVNNLSSKLMLSLFPPTLPFMRLEMSPDAKAAIVAESGEQSSQVVSEIEASLQLLEQQALSEFDTEGWRPALAEAMRLLVVTGNALIYDRPGGKSPVTADLRHYVVERDPDNRLRTVILRQGIGRQDAEERLGHELSREQMAATAADVAVEGGVTKDVLDLYTGARRLPNGRFEFWQEIAGEPIEGTKRQVSEDDLPLMPLQFCPIYGYSYGRGFVEDIQGDLLVLEQISRALAEAALVMSKVIFLTRPGSATKPASIAKAPNGSVRVGDPEDVGAVQADKGSDLAIAYQKQGDIAMSLSKSFLLNSSVQRAGERVTSEEIRYVAQELEDALGNTYAALAQTVQRPIVQYLFNRIRRTIPGIPKEVQPVIATGLEAISRNHRAMRIQQFLGALQQSVPPDQLIDFIRFEAVAADMATALNLPKDQYIRTPEELAEIAMQRQQQAAVESLGPEMLKQQAQQPTQ
jgi:hypothetical protein